MDEGTLNRAAYGVVPVAGLLLALAREPRPPARTDDAPWRFAAIVFAGEQPPQVLSVPLGDAPRVLRATYRVKLDRRLVGAIGEMHQIASGTPAGTVRASRTGSGWVLRYEADSVGTVPELPGYREVEQVLVSWGARLVARYPLRSGGVATADPASFGEQLGQLSLPAVAQGLRAIERGWADGHDATLLAPAGRALTLLLLQVPRQSEVVDPLAARAVATVALAAAAGQDVTRERVLLAHHLGYTGDAAALASSLGPDDPVRPFAEGDTLSLRRAAERPDASRLVRHLYLLKLVDAGDPAAWRRWQRRQAFQALFHSGVLGAALDFLDFGVDRSLAPLVPQQLFLEAARIAGRDVMAGSPPRARALFGGDDSAAVWNALLEDPMTPGRGAMLGRFEADLARLARGFSGPFLDGQALALYFRAQLHAAFERTCIHDVRGLASRTLAFRLVAAFRDAPEGFWTETVDWCRHRAWALAGQDSLRALASDLLAGTALSDRALSGTFDDIQHALRYGDTSGVGIARLYFARLDSRPSNLYRAGRIAADALYDAPLRERFYRRVVELAPADHSYLRVWWARYREDAAALAMLARDPTVEHADRSIAIFALLRSSGDSAAARAAFTRLIAEDPDDWDIRRDFVELLEDSRRFDEAAQVARQWLRSHPNTYGFDRTFATTALARQYQRLGRAQEAWNLLRPLISTWQLGVLQRAALAAIDLGRPQVAESLATMVVGRYPSSPHARITLAQVLWSQQRYGEVPAALHDAQHPLDIDAWREAIGPTFVGLFGRGRADVARSAFAALVSGGIPPNLLSAIPEAAADSSRYELAVSLREQLPPAPRGEAETWVQTYRYLKRWRGEAAALSWLRQRWPGGAPVTAALEFYRANQFDLLWTITTRPDQGSEGSYLWILRALAARRSPLPPDRAAALMAHFRPPSTLFYDLAGRYVLGLEPEATLLARGTDAHRRCEVSYYAGVRALAERRFEDASDWFRVAVETHSTRDWELLWAKDLLYAWAGESRTLPIAERQAAKRR